MVGDSIEPVGHQFAGPDRSRLANQDEEGRLKGILGVLVMAEDPLAHPPDHRAMALYESCKGSFIPVGDEMLQQLAIGQASPALPEDSLAKLLQDLTHLV